MNAERAALLVVAGGTGSRLGAGLHKALVPLAGRPLVEHCLLRLLALEELEPVILVGHRDDREALAAILARLPRPVTLVDGGKLRQDSVAAGLAALPRDTELVLVHDAARPFVPVDRIAPLVACARRTGAALLAISVADTIKEAQPVDATRAGPAGAGARAGGESPLVARTLPRGRLWAAQTPQAFAVAPLGRLLAEAAARGIAVTDEASLFEAAGLPVALVEGSRLNFKITDPEDLALAQALLAERKA
ncbi:MAG TPA: 2-C-methyl-D-erythritol 4-phosphate cytidylyltransferase [Planctomycetota bacterium]|nr:2-C-methyl-D-erythritol 4-phosphate cytidylyltransferase [Planctomycetota bacterium]